METIKLRTIETIKTRYQLERFRDSHGLRLDWHEPDEQGVRADFNLGDTLDNAHVGPEDRVDGSMGVFLYDDDHEDPVAYVNLAVLLALASGAERVG